MGIRSFQTIQKRYNQVQVSEDELLGALLGAVGLGHADLCSEMALLRIRCRGSGLSCGP